MVTPSGNTNIDALAYANWNAKLGGALTLTYSFPSAAPANATAEDRSGFAPMTSAQKEDVRTAMAAWSAVANITFREVASGGQLQLASNDQGSTSAAYAYFPQPYGTSGLYLNSALWYLGATTPNVYRINVLVHELGHSLGLKHPGDYNAGGGGSPGPYLPGALDNSDYTIMSYYDGASKAIDGKRPAAPMLFDVLAMQYLYGANTTWHTGNDVYTFTNAAAPRCIWDAGGINALDFSACTGATIIDLHAGTFSETAPGLHNVALAYGVAVQRAVAGAGGSTIRANDLGNVITGGAGADVVVGGAGNDDVAGGAGNDRLQGGGGNDTLAGGEGDDLLEGGAGNDTLDGGAGSDTAQFVLALAGYVGAATGTGELKFVDKLSGATVLLRDVEKLVFAGVSYTLAELQAGLASPAREHLVAGSFDTVGADILAGTARNDVHVVDTAGDVIVEAADGGRDTALVKIAQAGYAWTLSENVENVMVRGMTAGTVTGNAQANQLEGDGAANTLDGGAGDDVLDGGAGADRLLGGAGGDLLNGGRGADTLQGGAGDDVYVVDDAGDVVLEMVDGGTDRVQTALALYRLDDGVEQLRFTGRGAFAGTGNALDNRLAGGGWNDRLDGGAGNDTLIGGAGSDTLTGGAGSDTFVLRLGGGTDVVTDFVSGTDRLEVAAGAQPTIVTAAAEALTARAAALAIGPADAPYARGASALFAVHDGTATALYSFKSADGNAIVGAGELTQIAQLTGVVGVTASDFLLV
ncbi:M10 family metallopeptidase C-terminal domain-containing protein [Pseudoduganella armeniaca]|uniref:Peptidase metallopeptidase domain-containing protein n=1 Tax=Pseudoduganella armeniaca TaxID=2072590 RepID=A0A2R4C649_9BURK|nr:M10 family metallopeptidase C-terminal domain-containing protein [Pseudoduganella armeniaca]AVR95075.1 hypothetical protein C9I28_04585 [Pseudoduganella armeniaca]